MSTHTSLNHSTVSDLTTSDAVSSGTGERIFEFLTTKVARAAFALPFAVFGLFHFINASAMAGMVPLPGGVFWVYATGAALIAGSIGLLSGILGRWAALGLAALLATFIVTIHIPGLSNPQMQQMAIMGLLKDTGLLGGALAWARILKTSAHQ